MAYTPYPAPLPNSLSVTQFDTQTYYGYERQPFSVPGGPQIAGYSYLQSQSCEQSYNTGVVRTQTFIKSQRLSSQSARPYDASPSPTRTRFNDTLRRQSRGNFDASCYTYESNIRSAMTLTVSLSRDGRSGLSDRVPRAEPQPGIHGPSNHVLVPQEPYRDDKSDPKKDSPAIIFKVEGFPERGVKISDVMATYTPILEKKNELVFAGVSEILVSLYINWPGYPPAIKRIRSLRGNITKETLLICIGVKILAWARDVKGIRPKKGYEAWRIGKVIDPHDLFITKLVHCGASYWQAEIWAPQEVLCPYYSL